jgi:hypothetical protein
VVLHIGCHGKVALTNIHPNKGALFFWRRIGNSNTEADQEVEGLALLVIPQPGCSNVCPLVQERHVRGTAAIGNNHTPLQGQDADALLRLQAPVAVVIVGECR